MERCGRAGANSADFQITQSNSNVARTRTPSGSAPAIPDYLSQTYRWAYLDERNANYLDHDLIVRAILWQQHNRLEEAAFAEIGQGQRVLQSACVYGSFTTKLAEHIGPNGKLEVVDVSGLQVRKCQEKLADYRFASVRHENILHLPNDDFDTVCCYFLLHELPDDYKQKVIMRLLSSVRPGGKVVFIDYHKPHWAHPIKPLTSLIFWLLEPYAKGLWHKNIATFAGKRADVEWRKETFFGGFFQKVVATRID
jgi:ubiquinone/menaquinone biosynthesis C-methylase UbiE